MKYILRILPWKKTIQVSIALLALLTIFSFYGLYTNTFPVLKPANFVFPFLTLVHFAFLYVLWFKIKEDEGTDPQMRIIEYILYVVFLVYLFNTVQTIITLATYSDFSNHVMPITFLPIGILILILQLILLGTTLLAVKYRKELVGPYIFDDMNQHIDSWE